METDETGAGWGGDTGEGLRAAAAELAGLDRAARELSQSVGTGLRGALEQAALGGRRFSDSLRAVASELARTALRGALTPVQNAVGAGVEGLMRQGAAALVGAAGFRDGAAFSAGRVRAFAQGGVVQGPHVFAMPGGLGMMGEAGPEAILPLARGADGRLGVRGGGGGGSVQVTINIATPDVAGFERSRAQISASVARAVDAARRRM
ncbi:phage tail tape measure protein [Rubrimonas sp.]|uniref:phage tail tape measure protein n=1 Tax=Rubrimonas sp. TaxID=2036015 RepID=UPI002FDE8CE3